MPHFRNFAVYNVRGVNLEPEKRENLGSFYDGLSHKNGTDQTEEPLVEIFTYRYYGHSMADPDKTYRDKEEIKEYREQKDPVLLFEKELLAEKVLTPELSQAINEAAMAEADQAAAFADASPDPTVADITKNIYWEEDHRGPQTTSRGTIIFE